MEWAFFIVLVCAAVLGDRYNTKKIQKGKFIRYCNKSIVED